MDTGKRVMAFLCASASGVLLMQVGLMVERNNALGSACFTALMIYFVFLYYVTTIKEEV